MSDRLAPKPTAVVGPSSGASVPTTTLSSDDMPVFGGSKMSIPIFIIAFASYNFFEFRGRSLNREEVLGIVCVCYGRREPPDNNYSLYKRIENPDQSLNKKLDELTDSNKDYLRKQVSDLFQTYLERNPVARFGADELDGFQGRMTSLPWGHKDWAQSKPGLNLQTLRDEQLYLIHAIMHCCVDAGDNRITEFDTAQIVCRHYDYDTSPAIIAKSSVFKNLANPEHKLCQMVAHFINERRHKTFFEAKAHFLYDKYSRIGVLRFRTIIEGEIPSNAVPAATRELAKLSVGVTAGPSQARAPDTPQRTQDLFSQYTHLNSPEIQSPEASSPPDESTSHEATGKGKGRSLESSSSPSGEEVSGKGKGKGKVAKKPRK
ncbi:hypothetical protein HO133_008121 [Letharia lupina]|uniref:Uncharacterized protein n=1 Tax=Letharia lupina TaxID=560253 RepID=A0A8H6CSF7_9LECA|nr:uncharacterized protein HO133_008121 [Letharia lupina]KAF6228391.1 hypothetical protein HO133_008121 [Letharia lupina]